MRSRIIAAKGVSKFLVGHKKELLHCLLLWDRQDQWNLAQISVKHLEEAASNPSGTLDLYSAWSNESIAKRRWTFQLFEGET